ncbi:MAG: transcription antitermination factor NusB [Bacteroidaceae bacterium]|nr:transcription antitermination factor NusB [Bacteroidaceae bacterium]
MINREIIRLKAVQIAYAYSENNDKPVDVAEQELFFSLGKAHDLYKHLLLLMIGINDVAKRMVEMQISRQQRLGEENSISRKFVQNRFIAQLEQNEQLQAYKADQKFSWADEEEFLRRTYNRILEQGFYIEYMANAEDNYEEDREVWRKIYRTLLCNNDELDGILEEQSLYWNDDKAIVDTFVLKTIRRFEEATGEKQPLMPEYKDEADRNYAGLLFRTGLQNAETYSQLISAQTQHWDIARIARIDLVIMQLALAEMLTFPEIPVSVTINEFVEIAKAYSTPRSGAYVNGVLDAVAKQLMAEGKMIKN